jgi:predicted ArsR family transcriptional regulator
VEPGPRRSVDAELAALAPLAEPLRRRLYLYIAASPDAVGRDQAASALGIARPLAAFHLDRLVRDGLLRAEFMRRSGRTGPGAGRPAKLYRRGTEGHAVSLPARNYELAAQLFADALTAPKGGGGKKRLRDEARVCGRSTGERMAAEADPHGKRREPEEAASDSELVAALAQEGYEPRLDGDVIRLGNCPFHALVAAHRDLTCGMNLELMTGLLEGLGAGDWRASLDPRPGLCCVSFEPISSHATREHSAGTAG